MDAEFLYNPENNLNHCHGPSLFIDQDQTLFATWYAYPEEETRGGRIALAMRPKNANEWTKPRILFSEIHSSQGNPIVFRGHDGRLWCLFVIISGSYWNHAIIMASSSKDDGLSWTTPKTISSQKGLMLRHNPISTNQRDLLLPLYDEVSMESYLYSFDPFEVRMSQHLKFNKQDLIQPCITQEGATFVAVFRPRNEPRTPWLSTSTDRGKTWSNIRETGLPTALSGNSIISYQNKIAIIHNQTEEHQRFPLSMAVSKDRGFSFDPPIHIDQQKIELSYPSFATDQAGNVHGLYTYNRRMSKDVKLKKEEVWG